MFTRQIVARCLAGIMLLPGVSALAATVSFADGFEAPGFNPFWDVITPQVGTISLSADQAHTGGQSAKFDSPGGLGQRYAALQHIFDGPLTGAASIWFYDVAPNQETLYEQLNLTNSQTGFRAAVGTQDFDAFCYTAFVQPQGTSPNTQGPNANCGIYPQASTTAVARTSGWHEFTIDFTGSGVNLGIDGATVYSHPGAEAFDTITLFVQAPTWRPSSTAYFDDFSLEASAIPEPDTWALLALGLGGLFFARRKVSRAWPLSGFGYAGLRGE